jgi:hypothetical protein
MFEKKKDYPLSIFECFKHVKTFFFVLNFEHVNFASLMENIPKTIMTIQTILFPL